MVFSTAFPQPVPLEVVHPAPGQEVRVSQTALLPSDNEDDDAEDLQAA